MIHKVAAATLMVHSRHTGSSTPATTGSTNSYHYYWLGVVVVGRLLLAGVVGVVIIAVLDSVVVIALLFVVVVNRLIVLLLINKSVVQGIIVAAQYV